MAPAAHAARVAAPTDARLRVRRWTDRRGLVTTVLLLGLLGPLLGLLGWSREGSAAPSTPAFEDPEPFVSHNGAIQLAWSGEQGDYEVRLDERVIYRGRLPSAHLSGLREGDYAVFVRARDDEGWSPWSPAKQISVQHHSLPLVLALMALGLLTFAGTAVVVLRSSKSTPAKSTSGGSA